jgi:hypothetical protein
MILYEDAKKKKIFLEIGKTIPWLSIQLHLHQWMDGQQQ